MIIRRILIFVWLSVAFFCPLSRAALTAQEQRAKDSILARFNDRALGKQSLDDAVKLFPDVPPVTKAQILAKELTPPKVKHRVQPSYPKDLLKRRVQGLVWLAFVVDEKGNVSRAEALPYSDMEFAEVAVAAIKKWTFYPATRQGSPISRVVSVPLMFTFNR